MPTRKQKEVAELLRREVSSILLHKLKDPRMGFVTVTRVEAARDLRSATVYVTVRGSDAELEDTLEGLSHAGGYIQHLLAERLPLRFTPVLSFEQDEELLEAQRINRLIDEVRKEDKSVE